MFFVLLFIFVLMELFFGYGGFAVPRLGSWFVRCGVAVMKSMGNENALRAVWFVIIALSAVLVAAIVAMVTSVLGAPALTVLSSAGVSFASAFGLGITIHRFFRTS